MRQLYECNVRGRSRLVSETTDSEPFESLIPNETSVHKSKDRKWQLKMLGFETITQLVNAILAGTFKGYNKSDK